MAARAGHADAVAALLAAGADPRAVNTARRRVRTRRACADVASRQVVGDTPLHCAAASDSVGCARALLAAGADPGAANNFGKAPRDKAGSAAMKALLGAPAQGGPGASGAMPA